MNDIEVEVRLSHYTSNVEPYHGAYLEINDTASNARIVTVTLTPEQVYNLISSQGAKGAAEVLSPEAYEQRVGKEYMHEVVKLDEEFQKSIRMERQVTQNMQNFGLALQVDGDWQGYSWTLHNYGWSLRLWKYEAPDE